MTGAGIFLKRRKLLAVTVITGPGSVIHPSNFHSVNLCSCLFRAIKHSDPALNEITTYLGQVDQKVFYWEHVVCAGDGGHPEKQPGARSEDLEGSPAEVMLCSGG